MFKRFLKKRTESKIFNDIISQSIQEDYEVVIHVGAPKTGSSAIQKFLLENRKHLEKEGYYYPIHGLDKNGISGGHSNFGIAISKNEIDQAKEIFESHILKAKKRNCKLLLSAESLFNHHEKLKHVVNNYKCKIVVFYRDPIESIFSNYNQGVKRHFQTIDINTMCQNILNQNNDILSGKIFDKWCEVFNKENVSIIEYDINYFKIISIQEIFLRFLNISEKTISTIKPENFIIINKSYNLAQLELKRLLNNVIDKENEKLNNELDWVLQELSDKKIQDIKLIDTISDNIKNSLIEKYKNTKQNLLNLGIMNFNSTENSPNINHNKIYKYKDKISEILSIIENLEKNHEELHLYLENCIKVKLKDNINLQHEIQILAQWFNISYMNIQKEFWFTQNQLNNMAEGKYKVPDFLRDISVILKDKSDITNAKKIINKAFELRPNGPFIKKLKDEYENNIYN